MKGSKRNKQQKRRRNHRCSGNARSTARSQTTQTAVPPAFTETEEAFFAAGLALCEEHATAHAALEATAAEPRTSWWRRAWMRVPALAVE